MMQMERQGPCFPLTSLYLYLTDHCNLRCLHCWISPRYSEKKRDGIPLDTLKRTILEAKSLGLQDVKLTGGEPLLYEGILELLAFLRAEDLNINVETNGTLIDRGVAQCFQACNTTQVSVSLDGASADVHDDIRGVKGSFALACEGLRQLSDLGLNSQIIMTLQRKNKEDIPKMVELAKELGARSLKINHLVPCGRGKEAFERRQNLTPEELLCLYQEEGAQWPRADNGLKIVFDMPRAFASLEEIKGTGLCRCNILNIMGILANGDMSLCGIGQTVEALRMGNICQDSISELWHQSPILNDLRLSLPRELKGICGQCIFKFQCLGGCRANAYALDQDLCAPYFLCQQLYEGGLFPSSRRM
jgi:SynChlorMet cassette radical SAM/SPASM protein ScmF